MKRTKKIMINTLKLLVRNRGLKTYLPEDRHQPKLKEAFPILEHGKHHLKTSPLNCKIKNKFLF